MEQIESAIAYITYRILDDNGYPVKKEHLETALKALYKADKLQPIVYDKHYFQCPFCREDLGIDEDGMFVYEEIPPNYCQHCGQALDWSKEKGGAE